MPEAFAKSGCGYNSLGFGRKSGFLRPGGAALTSGFPRSCDVPPNFCMLIFMQLCKGHAIPRSGLSRLKSPDPDCNVQTLLRAKCTSSLSGRLILILFSPDRGSPFPLTCQ